MTTARKRAVKKLRIVEASPLLSGETRRLVIVEFDVEFGQTARERNRINNAFIDGWDVIKDIAKVVPNVENVIFCTETLSPMSHPVLGLAQCLQHLKHFLLIGADLKFDSDIPDSHLRSIARCFGQLPNCRLQLRGVFPKLEEPEPLLKEPRGLDEGKLEPLVNYISNALELDD